MKNVNVIGVVALVALGLGCSGRALKRRGLGGATAGGQGGSLSGSGTRLSGTGAEGGASNVAGATFSLGGAGAGGASLGSSAGSGGAPTDAGVAKDAALDTCLTTTCPFTNCRNGEKLAPMPQSCGCSICVPIEDAGVGKDTAPGRDSSADACLHLPCPMVVCAPGTRLVEHECACSTCEPVDAGTEVGKLACLGLDTCTCYSTQGCSVLTESCWCPAPECVAGACACGGGTALGCVPTELSSCAAAKARVASLCPNLSGPTFDGLCQAKNSACVTKCLNEVEACGDISCSMCEICDCAADAFMRCLGACRLLISPG
jgi:hypothetical protein